MDLAAVPHPGGGAELGPLFGAPLARFGQRVRRQQVEGRLLAALPVLAGGVRAIEKLLGLLDSLRPTGPDAKERVEELRTYLTNNKERMAYDVFRKEGRRSAAPIEGTNQHLVSKRMVVPGGRWTREGANAILAERCSYFSGRCDEDRHLAA